MILQKNIAEAEALLWVFIGFDASVAVFAPDPIVFLDAFYSERSDWNPISNALQHSKILDVW